jgi:hypothetical protein
VGRSGSASHCGGRDRRRCFAPVAFLTVVLAEREKQGSPCFPLDSRLGFVRPLKHPTRSRGVRRTTRTFASFGPMLGRRIRRQRGDAM